MYSEKLCSETMSTSGLSNPQWRLLFSLTHLFPSTPFLVWLTVLSLPWRHTIITCVYRPLWYSFERFSLTLVMDPLWFFSLLFLPYCSGTSGPGSRCVLFVVLVFFRHTEQFKETFRNLVDTEGPSHSVPRLVMSNGSSVVSFYLFLLELLTRSRDYTTPTVSLVRSAIGPSRHGQESRQLFDNLVCTSTVVHSSYFDDVVSTDKRF